MASRPPIDKLQKIVGERNVKIQRERVLISPENSQAVSEIVNLANGEKFKVLPLGSGSVLNLEKITSDNFVVLKSDKLNQIVRVVPEDLYVIVQAGFPLKDLNRHLESYNLFYPLADAGWAGTVGGSVATNLKGRVSERSVQTREYVLALEVIDPEGRVIRVGARTFKSVTGYDLARLFVGSWGTLGFISEVSLRLLPARKRKDYPSVALDQPARSSHKNRRDLKAALSSRIKESLDPNAVFPGFEYLA
ncbi:MAG: FAD-binding protein [candidate division Zixibacteria bacterium]|nr:FAD-binding protein [candidate division Zixibacteria bacterium]